jgi:hypothetical protein
MKAQTKTKLFVVDTDGLLAFTSMFESSDHNVANVGVGEEIHVAFACSAMHCPKVCLLVFDRERQCLSRDASLCMPK